MDTNICICGGGSLGIVCAGVFLSQGITVSMLTGHPDRWSRDVRVYDPDGKLFSGELSLISSSAESVIPQADIVLLCVPGYLIEPTLRNIRPYLRPETIVGSIVGSTGFFFAAHRILDPGNTLFAFQRVPFIARQRLYGAVGDLLGYKSSLNVAIENCSEPEKLAFTLSQLFMTPVNLLGNYYEASLTNSNPILHTGRLYSMWKDYDGTPFPEQGRFYAEWTDEASEILLKMDSEFMELLDTLNIRRGVIPSLLEYYESSDAASLTEKLRSITAFKSILSPMIRVEDGWIPDFGSRYFTEDFPFGLRIIKELAEENRVATPMIDKVYKWGMSKVPSAEKHF